MREAVGKPRGGAAALVAVVCLLGFAVVAALVSADRTAAFDRAIIDTVQGWESPALTRFMKGVSEIGTTLPVAALSLVWLAIAGFALRRRGTPLPFLAALLGSTLLNNVLKNWFERERPHFHRLVEEPSFSFPSGHAMAAVALYGSIACVLWRRSAGKSGVRALVAVAAAAVVVTIGTSRIYLGVHYPTDIIGGYLMSGCWVAATFAASDRIAFAVRRKRGRAAFGAENARAAGAPVGAEAEESA